MDAEIETMTEIAESFASPFTCGTPLPPDVSARPSTAASTMPSVSLGEALEIGTAPAERLSRLRLPVRPARSRSAGRRAALPELLAARSSATGERFPWIGRWRDALSRGRGSATNEPPGRSSNATLNEDFADLPQDGLWLLHVCGLAQAAC